jgi:hypothetical protein
MEIGHVAHQNKNELIFVGPTLINPSLTYICVIWQVMALGYG